MARLWRIVMTVQELIDRFQEFDDKSKIVCAIAFRENVHINDVEKSTTWDEIILVWNPMERLWHG